MIDIRSYTEMSRLPSFEERLEYLRLFGTVGMDTFGFDRYLNQMIYQRSKKWKSARNTVIIRDSGCDLGIDGIPIADKIFVHHMNPITIEDIEMDSPKLYDPEFLVCTSLLTHNAIHYGYNVPKVPSCIERKKGDTKLW